MNNIQIHENEKFLFCENSVMFKKIYISLFISPDRSRAKCSTGENYVAFIRKFGFKIYQLKPFQYDCHKKAIKIT